MDSHKSNQNYLEDIEEINDQQLFWSECTRLKNLSEEDWEVEKMNIPVEMREFISMCR